MTSFEIIKSLCERERISISTLEKELGYGNGSLSKAKTIPSDRIYDIAKRFNVSMEYLMTGEDLDSNIHGLGRINTIAAHLDDEELTKEDLEDIANYIKFVKSKKK